MQARNNAIFERLKAGEQSVALLLGSLFLILGIIGFIPGLTSMPAVSLDAPLSVPNLEFTDGYGNVLGLFPTNYLHNAIHLLVGVWGLAAATSLTGAIVFNRIFAILYAAIAVMGLLPITNTTFGLMPIFGNNVWFNALTALLAGYYGFVKPAAAANEISGGASPTA